MSNPVSSHFPMESAPKRKTGKSLSFFLVREAGLRRRKLRISCFRLSAKARSLRCGSFPHANRFAGFAREPPGEGRVLHTPTS